LELENKRTGRTTAENPKTSTVCRSQKRRHGRKPEERGEWKWRGTQVQKASMKKKGKRIRAPRRLITSGKRDRT